MIRYLENKPKLILGLKLMFVALFALAVTVPFAGQAFSFDGPLVLDFASVQADHPLQQHIDNFDYFGLHYDRYFNTHPRFLSLYFSLVSSLAGGISEIPIHLSMIVFTLMGGIGMFFLGRRFDVSGTAAALLFLSSPMMMISAHVEMVDGPGISLWIASLTTFIYGVDRKITPLLALSGILFLLTIFTFYQGFTVVGLAFLYLIMKRQLSLRTLAPVLIAVIAFLAYLGWFFSFYGQFPRFSYREINQVRLSAYYPKTLLVQLRSVLVILGGAVLFPLVTLIAFIRNWRAIIIAVVTAAISWPWLLMEYRDGAYSGLVAMMMALLLMAGILVVYMVVETAVVSIRTWKKGGNNDLLLPCVWFLSVFFYCVVILSYPAPRYFLPAAPAVILLMLALWRRALARWAFPRTVIAATAIGLTLAMSLVFSMIYQDYARQAPETAQWVMDKYGNRQGRVWFAGEFGFAYYMEKNGFTMIPNIQGKRYSETTGPWPLENAQPGDIIVTSTLYGGWLPFSDVLHRMLPVEEKTLRSRSQLLLITPISPEQRSRWSLSILLPYSFSDRSVVLDDIWVWEVADKPHPIWPETQEEVDKWE